MVKSQVQMSHGSDLATNQVMSGLKRARRKKEDPDVIVKIVQSDLLTSRKVSELFKLVNIVKTKGTYGVNARCELS